MNITIDRALRIEKQNQSKETSFELAEGKLLVTSKQSVNNTEKEKKMSMRKAQLLMKRLMDFALRNKTIVYTRQKEKRKRNICKRKKIFIDCGGF